MAGPAHGEDGICTWQPRAWLGQLLVLLLELLLVPWGGSREHFLPAGPASHSQLPHSGLAQGVSSSCPKLAFLSWKLPVKCSGVPQCPCVCGVSLVFMAAAGELPLQGSAGREFCIFVLFRSCFDKVSPCWLLQLHCCAGLSLLGVLGGEGGRRRALAVSSDVQQTGLGLTGKGSARGVSTGMGKEEMNLNLHCFW